MNTTATVEIWHDCAPGELICADESLVVCINAINMHPTFPHLGDTVVFTRWTGGIKVSTAFFDGNRCTLYETGEGEMFTYTEVLHRLAGAKL